METQLGKTVLELVSVDLLDDHPDNPRVLIRDDVIDGIVANLNGEWPQQHALHVRPLGDRFQIISGHHRRRAAEKAGIDSVWCWIEVMDDDEAFMCLATSNNQGELSPLEIGIHALKAVPVEKGGRGKSGGLSAYAEKIGKDQSNISKYRNAATVSKKVGNITYLLNKAGHLAAIHKSPEETWELLVEWMLRDKSVAETEQQVNRVCDVLKLIPQEIDHIFPVTEVTKAVLNDSGFGSGRIGEIADGISKITGLCESGDLPEDVKQAAWEWMSSSSDVWSPRAIMKKHAELLAEVVKKKDEDVSNWFCGDWREGIDRLEPGTVNLLLIDPPYGQNWQSNRRKEKKDKIAADESIADAVDELREAVLAMHDKMADDSHLLCFCRHDSVASFQAAIRTSGYNVKGLVVWVKNNHGTGDIRGGFLPKHELIIHAVKGKPQIFKSTPDVLTGAKTTTDRHPTEKPVAILTELIEATTVRGNLVVDIFAGVGSTCVAANQSGRDWFGCELVEAYSDVAKERLGIA